MTKKVVARYTNGYTDIMVGSIIKLTLKGVYTQEDAVKMLFAYETGFEDGRRAMQHEFEKAIGNKLNDLRHYPDDLE